MTKIEWTNETWNPIVGCNKISIGCDNCYAEKFANRLAAKSLKDDSSEYFDFSGIGAYAIVTLEGKWNGKTQLVPNALNKPLRWKKPRMIFVVSMGDLFHKSIPFAWIDQVFDIIAQPPRHTYQILTKRPDRMKQYFEHKNELLKDLGGYSPPPFIWLGVTIENEDQAHKRIPVLLNIPAAVRFVSIEPMLSAIDLTDGYNGNQLYNYLTGMGDLNQGFPWYKLDWVICGGESGSKARPMHPDWARSLRDQCKEAEVPFFFKQWGELLPGCQVNNVKQVGRNSVQYQSPHNPKKMNTYYKIGKKKAGRLLDGKEHNEMPIIK